MRPGRTHYMQATDSCVLAAFTHAWTDDTIVTARGGCLAHLCRVAAGRWLRQIYRANVAKQSLADSSWMRMP